VLFLPPVAFASNILRYWMGADFAAKGAVVMMYCCVGFYFNSLTMVPSLLALGMGKPVVNAIFASLTAALNLVLVYPFAKAWGVNGAAAALLVSSTPFPVFIYFVNRKIIGVSVAHYFKMVFGHVVPLGLLLFIVGSRAMVRFATSLWSFLAVMLVSYAVIGLFLYFVGLRNEERALLQERIRAVTGRVGTAA
jgi:O-antigen/teichoic acid export membrane protein